MKILIRLVLVIASLYSTAAIQASGIEPSYVHMMGCKSGYGNSLEKVVQFISPLNDVVYHFKGVDVRASVGARAFLLDGGQVIAETTDCRVEGLPISSTLHDFIVNFGGFLPEIGKIYTLRLAAGSVISADSDELTNDDIDIVFEVPADFGVGDTDFKSLSGINVTHYITHSRQKAYDWSAIWKWDAKLVGNPEWELYREGELIAKYPSHYSWDWDMSCITAQIDGDVYFDDGVNYRMVLPAGSVCSLYREDIVSRETSIDFVGGYSESNEAPRYVYCNAWFREVWEKVDLVEFLYDRGVQIETVPNKPIILTEEDDSGVRIFETLPEVEVTQGGDPCLVAHFGGIPLLEGKKYSLSVPDGTVRNAQSNVDAISNSKYALSTIGNVIKLSGVPADCIVNLYDNAGKVIKHLSASSDVVELEVPSPGFYILMAGDEVFKVVI